VQRGKRKTDKETLISKKGVFSSRKKVSFPLTKREFQTLRRENAFSLGLLLKAFSRKLMLLAADARSIV